MKAKVYRPVGKAYMIDRVCREMHNRKYANLFQVRWLDCLIQSAVEHVTLGVIQKGIDKYAAVTRQRRNPDWQILIAPGAENEIEVDDASELIENEVFEEFDPASFCRPAWRR